MMGKKIKVFTSKQVAGGLTAFLIFAAVLEVTVMLHMASPSTLLILLLISPLLWPLVARTFCSCGPCGKWPPWCHHPWFSFINPVKQWTCCNRPADDSGCKDICGGIEGVKCGREWGKPYKPKWGCISLWEDNVDKDYNGVVVFPNDGVQRRHQLTSNVPKGANIYNNNYIV